VVRSRFVIRVCQVCEHVHDECKCTEPRLTWLVVEKVVGTSRLALSPEASALPRGK
jgi:hypothetical protein